MRDNSVVETERQLIRLAADGDARAIRTLYDRYAPRVYATGTSSGVGPSLFVLVSAFLILLGFTLNALARFESQQFKLLWLGGSIAVGVFVYRIFQRYKRDRQRDHYGGTRT